DAETPLPRCEVERARRCRAEADRAGAVAGRRPQMNPRDVRLDRPGTTRLCLDTDGAGARGQIELDARRVDAEVAPLGGACDGERSDGQRYREEGRYHSHLAPPS